MFRLKFPIARGGARSSQSASALEPTVLRGRAAAREVSPSAKDTAGGAGVDGSW